MTETDAFEEIPTTYVLDTSVVVKWFHQLQEPNTQKAFQILQDLKDGKIAIVVPDLIIIELLNVFAKGKKSQPGEINEALKIFFALPLILKEPTLRLMKAANEIIKDHNITAYDGLFVALAQTENCQLISDDAKAHGRIADRRIIMLVDY